MKAGAILLAAGRGRRMKSVRPKALLPLRGRPLFLHALAAFLAVPSIRRIVLAVPAGLERGFARKLPRGACVTIVRGGRRRQDSVARALAAMPSDVDIVAVHDAARPLVTPYTIRRAVALASRHGAAVVAEPASDTIKRVRGGIVVETPDRATLWHAQTPQVFRASLLRRALALAGRHGWEATDCSSLVERAGGRVRVRVLRPDRPNPKVTRPGDLARIAALLR